MIKQYFYIIQLNEKIYLNRDNGRSETNNMLDAYKFNEDEVNNYLNTSLGNYLRRKYKNLKILEVECIVREYV